MCLSFPLGVALSERSRLVTTLGQQHMFEDHFRQTSFVRLLVLLLYYCLYYTRYKCFLNKLRRICETAEMYVPVRVRFRAARATSTRLLAYGAIGQMSTHNRVSSWAHRGWTAVYRHECGGTVHLAY